MCRHVGIPLDELFLQFDGPAKDQLGVPTLAVVPQQSPQAVQGGNELHAITRDVRIIRHQPIEDVPRRIQGVLGLVQLADGFKDPSDVGLGIGELHAVIRPGGWIGDDPILQILRFAEACHRLVRLLTVFQHQPDADERTGQIALALQVGGFGCGERTVQRQRPLECLLRVAHPADVSVQVAEVAPAQGQSGAELC